MHVSTSSDKQSKPPAPAGLPAPPDPAGAADPAPRPTRRVFSPEYKLAMVAEYENAAKRKARSYAGRASTPPTSSNGHELATQEP